VIITTVEVVRVVHHRRGCLVHVVVRWFHTAKIVDQR
jgi:hypothetical protein